MAAYRTFGTFLALQSLHFNNSRLLGISRNLRLREFRTKAGNSNGGAGKGSGINTLKLALLGTTVGATGGTIYSLINYWKGKESHKEHERTLPIRVAQFPVEVKITKRYINPNDKTGLDITLFQFQTCPFCCKVRAFLDYMGISYSVVEVDAVLRQDIKWSSQKKVPMVLIKQGDGMYVQMIDSSAIISLISTYLNDRRTDIGELADFYPTISFFDIADKNKLDIMNKYFLMFQERTPKGHTKEMEQMERKWRTWADQHLVHLISPNCYQSLDEAFETFQWFSEAGEWDIHFSKWERDLMVYVGAIAMWMISKILKRRHNLSDDVRGHIYDALNIWTSELDKCKTKFLGGKKPNLGDLAVYGILSSMEGCQTFKDCIEKTKISGWYYEVKELVQQNRGNLLRERIEGQVPPLLTNVSN